MNISRSHQYFLVQCICLLLFLFLTISSSAQSVLKNGNWVKLKITESGVYKITYDDLVNMGFSSPKIVQIYGNGAEELSLMNDSILPSTLHEIAIWIEKGNDNIFNSGDYILFYGQSPNKWYYDTTSNKYVYSHHSYTESNYYFITVNQHSNLGIKTQESLTNSSSETITTFDDLYIHEVNSYNPMKTGRTWFENISSSSTIKFTVPNIDITENIDLKIAVAGRNSSASTFSVTANGTSLSKITFSGTSDNSPYAYYSTRTYSITPTTESISITISPNFSGVDSRAYLDYCSIKAKRKLTMQTEQLIFRNADYISSSSTYGTFSIESPTNTSVWDISDPENPIKITTTYTNEKTTFIANTSKVNNYIAFNTNFITVDSYEKIVNQDILSDTSVNMIIMANDKFKEYAEKIADLHKEQDGLSSIIVNQEEIFNEFSAGRPDISALRNYFRYIYLKGGKLQYVLLFGDGSYDNRDFDVQSTNIMTFESKESLSENSSFVSDDFFGLLGNNKGVDESDNFSGELDVAIGRIPINTTREADDVTNKIINYSTKTSYRGSWQNYICMLADDADGNQTLHMEDADLLTKNISTNYPYFNFDKIYLDAYQQKTTGAGERYPDAVTAINERMKKGCLIFNYTGHGSESQMTGENVINAATIDGWKNKTKLPLFITASCEIARYDDPSITSLGENFLLQNDGGAIALFTTTRLVYSYSNYTLNNNIYKYLFSRDSQGNLLSIGQAFILAKQITSSDYNQNKLSFTLIGDPALKLAIPDYSITIDSINGISTSNFKDTVHALSTIQIKGAIQNKAGETQSNYNGTLHVTLFDKSQQVETLGNEGNDIFTFTAYKNTLFQGYASIKNGKYSTTLNIPEDILYYSGNARLSLYCNNDTTQGSGVFTNLPLTGTDSTVTNDNISPTLSLYMNDTNFVSGNITSEDPILYITVFDSSGINISNSAIGHSITLILDNDDENAIVLNDYYNADTNTYTSGTIKYPFSDLSEGYHTLTIKIYDSQNNVTEQTIEFYVYKLSDVSLVNLYNFPNPMSSNTTFHFEHNQADEEVAVTIKIYDISGNKVKTIKSVYTPSGYVDESISWDGKTDAGNFVKKGIYTYTVEVKSGNGKIQEGQQKIIVLN